MQKFLKSAQETLGNGVAALTVYNSVIVIVAVTAIYQAIKLHSYLTPLQ